MSNPIAHLAREPSGFEKHAVGILVTVITAVLMWIGYTSYQTSVGVARLEERIRQVTTNSEQIAVVDGRLRAAEDRLSVSESRLQAIEALLEYHLQGSEDKP